MRIKKNNAMAVLVLIGLFILLAAGPRLPFAIVYSGPEANVQITGITEWAIAGCIIFFGMAFLIWVIVKSDYIEIKTNKSSMKFKSKK